MNYYNEYDTHAAEWLRKLIAAGEIPPGDVDTRSITEISTHDLTGYTQHHFFAGIGGWPLALRLAGWPDSRPVRTGSCPCQPFSVAGRMLAEEDERHLWPVFRDLITFGEPTETFGEQVAGAAGLQWLEGVAEDMEGRGYAFAAAILPACAYGARHERKRIFWAANPRRTRQQRSIEHNGVSRRPREAQSVSGDALADARRYLLASGPSLLPSYGVSVSVARRALKGFGNAIVPEVGASFVTAYLDATEHQGDPRPSRAVGSSVWLAL